MRVSTILVTQRRRASGFASGHTDAVQQLKQALVTTTDLQIFDPDKPRHQKWARQSALLESEQKNRVRAKEDRGARVAAFGLQTGLRAIVHALTK